MFEFIWTRRNHCKHNGYEWFHDRRSALFHMRAFSQKSCGLPVSHRHKVRHKVTRAILANLGPETVFSVLEGGSRRGGRSGDHVSIFAGILRPRPQKCVDSLENCCKGKHLLQNLVKRMHKYRFGEMCSKVWVPLRLSKSLQKPTVNMFFVVFFALVLFRTRSWNPCKNQCEAAF